MGWDGFGRKAGAGAGVGHRLRLLSLCGFRAVGLTTLAGRALEWAHVVAEVGWLLLGFWQVSRLVVRWVVEQVTGASPCPY